MKCSHLLMLSLVALLGCGREPADELALLPPDDDDYYYFDDSMVADSDTIKILAVGNSFSQDAVESYLQGLFTAASVPVKIVSVAISDCSLRQHLINALRNNAEYPLRVVGGDGAVHEQSPGITLHDVLLYDDWTHVTVQQSSAYSGLYDSYQEALPRLLQFIRHRVHRYTQIALHQTWAYSPDCDRPGFVNYGNDQRVMYQGIVQCSRRAMEDFDIDMIIPTGTAIQNCRVALYDFDLTRDGSHLDPGIGRYIAACTWLEALCGVGVGTIAIDEAPIVEAESAIVYRCVRNAILSPYAITAP